MVIASDLLAEADTSLRYRSCRQVLAGISVDIGADLLRPWPSGELGDDLRLVDPTSTLAAVAGVAADAVAFDAIAGANTDDVSNLLALSRTPGTVEMCEPGQVLAGGASGRVRSDPFAEADMVLADWCWRALPGVAMAGSSVNRR